MRVSKNLSDQTYREISSEAVQIFKHHLMNRFILSKKPFEPVDEAWENLPELLLKTSVPPSNSPDLR